MYSAILLSAAILTQCENGVCRAPVRAVIEKTKTVVVDKQPARTVVKKIVRERERRPLRRLAFWR